MRSLELDPDTGIHDSSVCPPAVAVGSDSNSHLKDIQDKLNRLGASDLIVKIITRSPSTAVFREAILLAQTLLYGGNAAVQVMDCGWMAECWVEGAGVRSEMVKGN